MTTFALVTLKLPPSIAMLAPIFIGIFGAIAGIFGGLCADRVGRFAINVLPCVLFVVLAFPALSVVVAAGLALFGGSVQFVATSIVAYTGDARSIAGVFALATAISLLTFFANTPTELYYRSVALELGARKPSCVPCSRGARLSKTCRRRRFYKWRGSSFGA